MHPRIHAVLIGTLTAAGFAACEPSSEIFADFEVIPSATVPILAASPWSAPVALSSAPVASASGSSSATVLASGSSSGSASAAPRPPAKEFACGDKGKPDCPMQRWMKGVAGGAVASGDTERLARAFNAMSKAPSGFGGWGGICATGAAKAQAGDFDGAKAQCKVCHSKYQSRYHSSMRDNPWP